MEIFIKLNLLIQKNIKSIKTYFILQIIDIANFDI